MGTQGHAEHSAACGQGLGQTDGCGAGGLEGSGWVLGVEYHYRTCVYIVVYVGSIYIIE